MNSAIKTLKKQIKELGIELRIFSKGVNNDINIFNVVEKELKEHNEAVKQLESLAMKAIKITKTVMCVKLTMDYDHLTVGKVYDVIASANKSFAIISDKGAKKYYKHGSSTFKQLEK